MNNLLKLGALGVGAWLAYQTFGRPRYSFAGKTVLITGGSRGLGLVLARMLVQQGARVAICARDREELQIASNDLRQDGGQAYGITCDVTDQASVRHMVAAVQRQLGPVDVLFNNAGIMVVGPLETQTVADFEAAMKTHFWASLYTTLEVLPAMRQRHSGRIVNISSIGGKVPIPHMLPYLASKYAVTGLSEGLRVELAREGITVTTVCPGLMRTGSHINAEFKGQHDKEYAWFALGAALPVMSTSAESAARTILNSVARGDSELVFTIPARAAVTLHALCPEFFEGLSSLVNRWGLPGPGDGDRTKVPGRESRGLLPECVTGRADEASLENNETVAGRYSSAPPPLPVGG